MRVWRFDEFQGLESLHLHSEPTPAPQRGEVLLRVRAVSLNYRDIAMPLGLYPAPSETGHIPTSDAAAEVVAVGEDVRLFRPGDRVISSFHRRWFGGPPPAGWERDGYDALEDGWLAEYKVGSRTDLQDVVRAISALKLQPVIDQVFTFDQAPAAFERLQSGQHIGKVVINLPV